MTEEKISIIMGCFMFAAMFVIVAYVIYDIETDDYFDKEYIIVEGTVTEVIPVKDNDGSIEYYHICFDTGEQYRIKILSKSMDFTVNSKLIIELYWYPNRDNDIKYLNQLVRVPDGD